VFNLLLQIFDDGHLTDARDAAWTSATSVIIMTSNIGAETIRKGTTMGFMQRSDEAKAKAQSYDRMRDNLLEELKKSSGRSSSTAWTARWSSIRSPKNRYAPSWT
jgi:ATP-dependent Clp protease ATP-binding subunit ClpC